MHCYAVQYGWHPKKSLCRITQQLHQNVFENSGFKTSPYILKTWDELLSIMALHIIAPLVFIDQSELSK